MCQTAYKMSSKNYKLDIFTTLVVLVLKQYVTFLMLSLWFAFNLFCIQLMLKWYDSKK